MIAANLRKHPDALALQLPLLFPHRLVWALPRPGARVLRAIRVARAKAFDAAGRIAYPVKAAIPAWWKEAKARARDLAKTVKAACLVLWAEVRVSDTDPARLVAFNYERDLDQAIDQATKSGNRYRQNVLRRKKEQQQRFFNAGCPRCEHKWVRLLPSLDAKTPQWPQCTNCGASWHPDYYDQAKRELNEPDDF